MTDVLEGFNTSHVVVYRVPMFSSPEKYTCFNTSHVVVYPFRLA